MLVIQVEDVLTAGDIEELGGQLYTLNEVGQLSGLPLGDLKIGD